MAEAPRLSRRARAIRPFHVMDLLARARRLEAQGRRIVHMEIGEPHFPTPEPVVEAARRALAAGRTCYTPALGLPALREAIAAHYARFGARVEPRRVVVTPGSSGALLLALAAVLDPGEKVLMGDPGYPCNRHFVRLLEGRAVAVPVGPDTAYQPTRALLEPRWDERTAAAMVASPANPTGTCLEREALAALLDLARHRGGVLVVDEIYHRLVYDAPPTTVLALSDEALVVNSFSKYHAMTGWRLGWLVAPEAYVAALDRLAQNLFLAAPTLAQYAALAAFTPETEAVLEARRRELAARRDFLVPALERLGFRVAVRPQGAFYVYADCSAFGEDSHALSRRLLEEAGVAVTPGCDFGEHQAARHLRFSYTAPMGDLEEGVRRLAAHLGG